MASKRTQRKLTAILSADVVGYSRLMGDDEEATIETLTAYRKVFVSEIKKHRGRVVDAKGDAILAEFASVVDAVGSAVEIQRELAEKNADLPDDRRMDFRIGINLGDVVLKDDVIYGDGVNIAARLESLSEPGGICVSRSAYDQVKNKLKLAYEYLGEREVKNIAEPVRAYQMKLPPSDTQEQIEQPDPISAVSVMPGGVSLDLPDRPSIAVLPFKNLSGDPEQEYFSDGMTEDLITDLSRIAGISVIASNTMFTYKNRAVNVELVAKELKVKHVLEGSVRKAGNRVRINVQLINAKTGDHLWAERYDRDFQDIFAMQDEVAQHIVTALDVQLVTGEQARIYRRTARSPEAYDLFLRARNFWQFNFGREGYARARPLAEQAIAIDPTFAMPYGILGSLHLHVARFGWSESPEQSLELGFQLVKKAIALDDSLGYAHVQIALYYLYKREHDRALAEGERAIALNPEAADVMFHFAMVQHYSGRPALAAETVRKAMLLIPNYPGWFPGILGRAYVLLGRHEEAVAPLMEFRVGSPDSILPHVYLAAAYAALGRNGDAEAEVKEVLRIRPDFSLAEWLPKTEPYPEADLKRVMEMLRKAGLPE